MTCMGVRAAINAISLSKSIVRSSYTSQYQACEALRR